MCIYTLHKSTQIGNWNETIRLSQSDIVQAESSKGVREVS